MYLPNKMKLPDIYVSEMGEYARLVQKYNRTTSGQVGFTSASSGVTYNTTGTAYDNGGEAGLILLLYNVNPILKNYIFDEETYNLIQDRITTGASTIPTTGWVANIGDNALKLDLAIPNVVVGDNVRLTIDKNYHDTASDAEINSTVDEYAGGVTIYANKAPAVAIPIRYEVVK